MAASLHNLTIVMHKPILWYGFSADTRATDDDLTNSSKTAHFRHEQSFFPDAAPAGCTAAQAALDPTPDGLENSTKLLDEEQLDRVSVESVD